MSRDQGSPNLKGAASLLRNGGTLLNEPCNVCSGVQVGYRDKIICINCGKEKSAHNEPSSIQQKAEEVNIQGTSQSSQVWPTMHEREGQAFLQERDRSDFNGLRNISLLLTEKIAAELAEIKGEKDQELLGRKAEIIKVFLGLLQKVKEIERL